MIIQWGVEPEKLRLRARANAQVEHEVVCMHLTLLPLGSWLDNSAVASAASLNIEVSCPTGACVFVTYHILCEIGYKVGSACLGTWMGRHDSCCMHSSLHH